MSPEIAVGWESSKQKLLVLVTLDDDVAVALSSNAGEGFFRAFIVEDRKTGEITCNFRFRYKNGDSWYTIGKQRATSRAEVVAELQEGIEKVITEAIMRLSGLKPPKNIMHSYYVPDDGGDPEKTLQWLLEKDLVRIAKIEENAE